MQFNNTESNQDQNSHNSQVIVTSQTGGKQQENIQVGKINVVQSFPIVLMSGHNDNE